MINDGETSILGQTYCVLFLAYWCHTDDDCVIMMGISDVKCQRYRGNEGLYQDNISTLKVRGASELEIVWRHRQTVHTCMSSISLYLSMLRCHLWQSPSWGCQLSSCCSSDCSKKNWILWNISCSKSFFNDWESVLKSHINQSHSKLVTQYSLPHHHQLSELL